MTTLPASRPRRTAVGVVLACAAVAAGVTPVVLGSAAAAAPLQAPPLVGPAEAGPVLKEVVLDWAPVTGAASYVVQVGTDEEWADDPVLELSTVASRLTLPTSLPHASYVWRVAGLSAQGQGRWSAAGTFTRGWSAAPEPLGPVGAVDPAAGVPTFSWTPVPTASEYQLQVSTSRFFDAPFRSQAGVGTESCFTTRTTVTPFNGQADPRSADAAGACRFTLLGTGAQLHWRVRALDRVVDAAAPVDTTPVVDEGISAQPPAPAGELDTGACPERPEPIGSSAPVGNGPSASPSASATPSASASPSATPSSSTSPDAGEQGGSCEPAHQVEKGAWSRSTAFSHVLALAPTAPYYGDLPVPARPSAAADACEGDLCRDFPTVSWAPVPGAQWYRVSVALDAAYTNVQSIAETPATTWTPTSAWRDSSGGAFHVVVQACTVRPTVDGRGPGCGAPSAPLVVRKSTPRLSGTSPVHGAVVAGSEVVLSWSGLSEALSTATGAPATSEAYGYRVQVARADAGSFSAAGLVEELLVDTTHHVSTEVRYPDGEYLWRVQPVDASGHALPWTAAQAFTRDGTAPTWSVDSAGRLSPSAAVSVRFSEPVTGVDHRSVSLVGVPTALVVAPDGRSATLTPQRPLVPGARHGLAVTAAVRDRAGNAVTAGHVVTAVDPVVDDRSPSLVLAGSWQRLAATNAVGGTWSRSVPTPARRTSATALVQGRGAEVKGCVGPASGMVEVWGDGRLLSRVDTYRSYSGCGVVLARAAFANDGHHWVVVRGTGAKSPRSRGTAVGVDAITAVR